MHKFYGFLIASAFALGLALPHVANAGGPLDQYAPSGTTGKGSACVDPKQPCDHEAPGSGLVSMGGSNIDPPPQEFGMCATCASKKGVRGKVCATSNKGVPPWACKTADIGGIWGSSEPYMSCIRLSGANDATCDGSGSF